MPRYPLPEGYVWCHRCGDHIHHSWTATQCAVCTRLDALPPPCEACGEPAPDPPLCQKCLNVAERELRYLIVLGSGLDD